VVFENAVIGAGPVGLLTTLSLESRRPGSTVVIDAGNRRNLLTEAIEVTSNVDYLSHVGHSLSSHSNVSIWYGALQDLNLKNYREFGGQDFLVDCWQTHQARINSLLSVKNFEFGSNQPSHQSGRVNDYSSEEIEVVFAKVIRDPRLTKVVRLLKSLGRPEVLNNHLALQLIPNEHTIEIICQDEGGSIASIHAKNLYLALGTIENTRLLLNSQLSTSTQYSYYLGQYLSDHLSISIGDINSQNLSKVVSLFARRRSRDGHKLWPRIQHNVDTLRKNVEGFAHATHFNFGDSAPNYYRLLRKFNREDLYRSKQSNGSFRLHFMFEKTNNQYNALTLKKKDTDSVSPVSINFQVANEELEKIRTEMEYYLYGLERWGLIESPIPATTEITFDNIKTAIHPSGTYRMSLSPKYGVVDGLSRLWSDQRVRVLGAGVFPRAFSTHPTYTSLILAMHALETECADVL